MVAIVEDLGCGVCVCGGGSIRKLLSKFNFREPLEFFIVLCVHSRRLRD